MPDRESQRVAKLLARAGVASRREVERMIAEGRVAKDGVALSTPATVLPSLQGVTVDGEPVEAPAPARLFLYHKPPGLLVTESDPNGRTTIYDRLPSDLPRVVPVGRLDLRTEGLLLLTTDGELKRQLELPATGVERAYRARAYGVVTQARLEDLIEGVEIEGIRYGSINANLERRTGANVWIELILTEGKNREVRRVLEHLGLRVSRLIRTRYGPFVLGDLPPGEVGEVRRHDVESFRKHPTRLDLPQPARARAVATPAPKPLHHRPKRADGPLPKTSSGRIEGRERPAPLRNEKAVAAVTNPPRARLGEGELRVEQPRAVRGRSGEATDPQLSPAASGGGAERTAVRKHFRAAPKSTAKPASAPIDAPKRAFGKPDRTGKTASPARAARTKAHRAATGGDVTDRSPTDRSATGRTGPASASKTPHGAPPKRPAPPRPAPPRPPRTRK